MYYISFLNKWVHLFSITGVLGGILFGLLVLAPALRSAPQDDPTGKEIWKRFGMILGILWLIALLTGFINLGLVSPKVNGHYQMYAGIKMVLALVMFVLSARSVQKFFPNRSTWLLILSVLGVLILGISANLNLSRISGRGLKPTVNSAAQSGKGEETTPGSAPTSGTAR